MLTQINKMRNKFLNNQKLKLYHGSESYDITEFKTPAFFINKLEVAQYFQEKNGGAIYEVTLDVKKPFMLNYPNSYEKVFSLLDSLKIPYSLDREKMEAGKPFFLCPEINKHNSKYKGDNINDFVYIPQVVLALKKTKL